MGVKKFVSIVFLLISFNGYSQHKLAGEYIAIPSSSTDNRSIVFEENGTFTINQRYYPPQGFTLEPRFDQISCPGFYEISADTLTLDIPYKQLYKDSSRYIVVEEEELTQDDGRAQSIITLEVYNRLYLMNKEEGVEYLKEEKVESFGLSFFDKNGNEDYFIYMNRLSNDQLNDISIRVFCFNKIGIRYSRSYPLEIDTELFKNKKVKLKCILYGVKNGYCGYSGALPNKFLIKKNTNKKLVLKSLEEKEETTYLKKE